MLVKKIWGFFFVLKTFYNFKIKLLVINKNKKISLQKHLFRNEYWLILSGKSFVTINNTHYYNNNIFAIKKNEIHCIENIGKKNIILIEIQTGNYLDEDDIIRLN